MKDSLWPARLISQAAFQLSHMQTSAHQNLHPGMTWTDVSMNMCFCRAAWPCRSRGTAWAALKCTAPMNTAAHYPGQSGKPPAALQALRSKDQDSVCSLWQVRQHTCC